MKYKAILLICLSIITTSCATMNFDVPNVRAINDRTIKGDLRLITVYVPDEDEELNGNNLTFYQYSERALFKATFKSALEDAMTKANIFDDAASVKLVLDAKLINFDTPAISINFQTNSTVRYTLSVKSSGQIIYQKDIYSKGESQWNYAFIAYERALDARNNSVRNNIQAFIYDLSTSNISVGTDSGITNIPDSYKYRSLSNTVKNQ